MVQINFASREVNCKIVYYGPGRCGKTTNLQLVHEKAPANSTGELVSIATETDRTLYFDFLPLDLGTVAGMRTKFQLYTVPGQVYYDATRKLVLQGCDGIVFVADSNPDLMAENIESLDNLAKNLRENGLDIMDLPIVLQFNKRDLPTTMSVDEMNAKLNRNNWPIVEAVAVNGDGVFQTLKAISQGVIKRLNREQGYNEAGQKPPRTSALGGASRPASTSGHAKAVAGNPPAQPPGANRIPPPAPKAPGATPGPKIVGAPIPPKMQHTPTATAKPPVAAKTPIANVPANRSFDAPSHGGDMGSPKPAGNPFRDRLAEIRKQSGDTGGAHSKDGDAHAESSGDGDGEEHQPRKGCLTRLFKGGAAAALMITAIVYWFCS